MLELRKLKVRATVTHPPSPVFSGPTPGPGTVRHVMVHSSFSHSGLGVSLTGPGPLSAWHWPPCPPWQEQLISPQAYVKCFHICCCLWNGQEEARIAHGGQVAVKAPHPAEGRASTGTWTLMFLVQSFHILHLMSTAKKWCFPSW